MGLSDFSTGLRFPKSADPCAAHKRSEYDSTCRRRAHARSAGWALLLSSVEQLCLCCLPLAVIETAEDAVTSDTRDDARAEDLGAIEPEGHRDLLARGDKRGLERAGRGTRREWLRIGVLVGLGVRIIV